MTHRVLALGDIHGCDVALETLLDRIELTTDDTVVILGDAIDRGPGSRQVLERIIGLQTVCQVEFVLGNHEEMLLDALAGVRGDRWLRYGGNATLRSYGGTLDRFPDDHRLLLEQARSYWENESTIGIHANLEPGVDLANQQPQWLRWQSLTGMEFPHPSGRQVVCGHSGIPDGLPAIGDGWVCIDTLAYSGGYLTCLDTETGEIFQSQQTGAFRGGVFIQELMD
ncbi:MAG: metallophosphoesterase [Planctomycetes bacterium]|nr:metallophosphoesterase [Planctomycetota bacterium]